MVFFHSFIPGTRVTPRNRQRLLLVFLALLLFPGTLYLTPLFTPAIDGFKEAGWGSTPDATSAGSAAYGPDATPAGNDTYHFSNPCRDIYVTDDPDNLYIGYFYNGDGWSTDGAGVSARLMFGFITNASGSSGGTYDPWEATTTFASGNQPDYFLRQWVEGPYDERMEFGGALGWSSETKGVAEFLAWDGSAWVGTGISINHYERLTDSGSANNWGEIAIPLDALGVKTGDSVKLFYYYRPANTKPGFVDSTPYDSDGASDYGDVGGELSESFSYSIRSDNINPALSSITPSMGQTGQARSCDIAFTATDNASLPLNNILVIVEGNVAYTNSTAGSGYSASSTSVTDGYSLTIDPDVDFNYEQRVNVTIRAWDNSGNSSETTYYFDIEPDTTAPAVSNKQPAEGSSSASRGTSIQLLVNDDYQVSQSSLSISVNGTPAVSGGAFQSGFDGAASQILPEDNGYQVTIDPVADFDYEESVTVAVSAQDTSGNPVSDSYSFTITADDIPPDISSQNPGDGANNIARNATISFQVMDNIEAASNQLDVSINGSDAIIDGAVQSGFSASITENSGNLDVLLQQDSDWSFSETVTVAVTARDTENNATSESWQFTCKADDIAPTLNSRSPAPGASDQEKNTSITFSLDDDTQVDITSVDISVNGQDAVLSGSSQNSYIWSYTAVGKGYDCTLTPPDDFNYEQTVSVQLSVTDDTVNNNLLSTSWSFDIKADDVKPVMTGATPAPGATGIAEDSDLTIQVSDDTMVDNSTLVITVNSSVALSNGVFEAPYDGPLSQINAGSSDSTITLDRSTDFPFDSVNTVSVTAEDGKNNTLTTNYQFTIQGDDVPPVFSEQSPPNASSEIANNTAISLKITDNVAVDASTINISMTSNGSASVPVFVNGVLQSGFSGSVNAISGGFQISFQQDINFEFNTTVSLSVDARDSSGNQQILSSWGFTIQGGDDTPPTISKMNPHNGQSGVEPDSLLYFETADNVQVSTNTICATVTFPGGSVMTAITNGSFVTPFNGPLSRMVSNDYHGYDIYIDYTGEFDYTNTYTVCSRIQDTSINSNEAEATFSFTTRPPDTDAPQITRWTPEDQAVDVPISSTITFHSKDNYGIVSNEMLITLNEAVILSNGNFSDAFIEKSTISANADNGYSVTLQPSSEWDFGSTIDVQVDLRDTSSNSSRHNISFKVQELEPARPLSNSIDPNRGSNQVIIKINRTGYAEVRIYNLRGEQVYSLPRRYYTIGDTISWTGILEESGDKVGSGYYFIRITGTDINTTVRAIIIN